MIHRSEDDGPTAPASGAPPDTPGVAEAGALLEPLGQAGDTLADYVADVGSGLADGSRDSWHVVEAINALTTAERATFRALEHLTQAIAAGDYTPRADPA